METEEEQSERIDKIYLLPFSVETVYQAWTSSETVIAPATSMKVEPHVGGTYRLNVDREGFTTYNEGKFLQVVPEHVVQYTWEWNGDGNVTQITVLFNEHGNGTELHLVHDGFNCRESLDLHADGWDKYIRGLAEFLSAGAGKQQLA